MIKVPEMEGEAGDVLLSSLDWTDDEVIALSEAIISDGKLVIPAGVNKHFNMIVLLKKFQTLTKKRVESKVLWDRIHSYYDISKLDKLITCPFPNEMKEFSLPENDFSQLIKDRKNQSSSQDKQLDDESRDSGSGRETPPTLPIAKRAASVQSSASKRKHSASVSETSSETTGRKTHSSTPSGGGPSKAKRRI